MPQGLSVKGPDGKTYQFPSDATDAEITAFFEPPKDKTPAKVGTPQPIQGRGTGYDQRNAPANLAMLKRNAPMLAGMAAAPFTEGMSIPAAMAVTGGAAGVTSLARGDTPMEAAGEAALNGGPEALRLLKYAPEAATALYRKAAGGASREGAEMALESGRGTFTQANMDTFSRSKILDSTGKPFRSEQSPAYWAIRNGVERGTKGPNLGTEAAAGAAGDMLAGRKGAALGVVGSTVARPGTTSWIAQQLHSVGTGGHDPATLAQALRMALISILGGGDERK